MAKQEAEYRCENCGYLADKRDGSYICPRCGHVLLPSSHNKRLGKMKTCKSCGNEIAKSAYRCPNCGAKVNNPTLIIVGLVVLILLFGRHLIRIGRTNYTDTIEKSTSVQVETREEYIASCKAIPYEEIARNPDTYKNTRVTFNGRVIQVVEGSGNSVIYRVATADYYNDVVYVSYTRKENESRLLKDDDIVLYGDCKGVTSYTSTLGNKITIPSVAMKYYELQQ